MFSDVLLPHECELWILDELTEADHQAPWIWSTCLEALQKDLADLLLNNLSTRVGVFGFGIDEENDAREVERVVVWETQLVYNSIQEAQSGAVVQRLYNLGEGIHRFSMPLNSWVLLARLLGNEEHHCAYNLRIDPPSIVNNFFTLFHLTADFHEQLLVSLVLLGVLLFVIVSMSPGEVLKVLSQSHGQQAASIIG